MNGTARTAGLASIGALLVTAGVALAQEVAKTPPADADALRGPKLVQRGGVAPTLVHNDASGKLERLDARPEQAALDVMKLTAEERTGADAVLAARAVAVNKALQEHYEAFLKIQVARQGGAKPEEIRPLMREFRPAVEGLLVPGLEQSVADALPEGRRAEFRKLVDEYKLALAASEGHGERGGGGGRGRGVAGREGRGDEMKPGDDLSGTAKEKPTEARVPARVEMNLLLREIGRALKGIVDERKERMDAFLKAIDATPEQEAKIRGIARETAEKNRKDGGNGGVGELTQDEKIANWRKILDVLTPEQRRKAMQERGR